MHPFEIFTNFFALFAAFAVEKVFAVQSRMTTEKSQSHREEAKTAKVS